MNVAFLGASVSSITNMLYAASPSQDSGAPKDHKLLIGWASKDITPAKPVALAGQFHVRVSKYVNDPITATALAIEAGNDQAIMVSCDLVAIRSGIQDKLRKLVEPRLPGFDIKKLFLNATHTHTGPVTVEGNYPEQGPEVMTPTEYVDFFLDRLCDLVVEAWENRKPGGISWALGHAVVGHNRRAVYLDGSAKMYGSTNRDDFACIEGYEDHSLNMLFFWNQEKEFTGIVINIACPSQVTEGEHYVSADFWHEVRKELRGRYTQDLFILPQCAAAGDQSPHFLLSGRAEENMRKRKGVSEREEIAIKIADAVDYTFSSAESDIQTDIAFKHVVEDVGLPVRKVTEEELDRANAEYDRLTKKPDKGSSDLSHLRRNKGVIDRYKQQEKEPFYQIELHVIRIGDIAIATNSFELFLDYGMRIKARSKALQTFTVQLACSSSGYLPTAKAVAGGGYGAEAVSNRVGPEGGQVLVDRTVDLISETWGSE